MRLPSVTSVNRNFDRKCPLGIGKKSCKKKLSCNDDLNKRDGLFIMDTKRDIL